MMKRIVAALVVCVLVGGWVVAQDEPPVLTWGGLGYMTIDLARGSYPNGDLGYKDPETGKILDRVAGNGRSQFGRLFVNMTQQTGLGTVLGMIRLQQQADAFGNLAEKNNSSLFMEGYAAWRPDPMFTVMWGQGINGMLGGSAMNRYYLPEDTDGVQLYAQNVSVGNAYIGSGFSNGLGFAIVPIPDTLYVHIGLPYLVNTKPAAGKEWTDAKDLSNVLSQVHARAYYNMDGGRIGLGYSGGSIAKAEEKLDTTVTGWTETTTIGNMYLFYQNTMVDNLSLRLGLRYRAPASISYKPNQTTKDAWEAAGNEGKAPKVDGTGASLFVAGLTADYDTGSFGVYLGGVFITYLGGEENKKMQEYQKLAAMLDAKNKLTSDSWADTRASYRETASQFSIELAPYYAVTDNVKAVLAGSFGMDLAGADRQNGEGKKSIEARTFWGINPYCSIDVGTTMTFQLGLQLWGNNGANADLKANGTRQKEVMNWAIPMTLLVSF
jgi:hypothetical protein